MAVTAWQAGQRWVSMRQPLSHCPWHTCSWIPCTAWPLGNTSWGLKFEPHRWFVSRGFFWMSDPNGSPRLAAGGGRTRHNAALTPSTPQVWSRIGLAVEASVGQIKWTQLAEMMERFSSRCPNGGGASTHPRPRGSAQHWRHWQMHYWKLHGHLIS